MFGNRNGSGNGNGIAARHLVFKRVYRVSGKSGFSAFFRPIIGFEEDGREKSSFEVIVVIFG